MGLVSDAKAARKVLRNALRSRNTRRELARLTVAEGTGEQADVEIVV